MSESIEVMECVSCTFSCRGMTSGSASPPGLAPSTVWLSSTPWSHRSNPEVEVWGTVVFPGWRRLVLLVACMSCTGLPDFSCKDREKCIVNWGWLMLATHLWCLCVCNIIMVCMSYCIHYASISIHHSFAQHVSKFDVMFHFFDIHIQRCKGLYGGDWSSLLD